MLRLTRRMDEVLALVLRGASEAEAARRLGITRQAVSKTLREARSRFAEAVLTLADTLNSDVVRVDLGRFYAVLRSRQTGLKIYLIYIPGAGMRTVFEGSLDGVDKGLCEEFVRAAVERGLVGGGGDPRGLLARVLKAMEG